MPPPPLGEEKTASMALRPGAHPRVLVRGELAEIDRREGYVVQLRAALVARTASVSLSLHLP